MKVTKNDKEIAFLVTLFAQFLLFEKKEKEKDEKTTISKFDELLYLYCFELYMFMALEDINTDSMTVLKAIIFILTIIVF